MDSRLINIVSKSLLLTLFFSAASCNHSTVQKSFGDLTNSPSSAVAPTFSPMPTPSSTPTPTPPPISVAYYVSISGSDSNPGTLTQPFRTIQKAATVVTQGATVYVRAGTYYEDQLNLTVSGATQNPITFQGYPGDPTPIIDFGLQASGSWQVYSGSGANTVYRVLPAYGSSTHHWPQNTQHVIINGQILNPISSTTCPVHTVAASCVPNLTPGTFYSSDESGSGYGYLYVIPPDGSNPNNVSVTIMNSNGDSGVIYNTGLYNFAFSNVNNNLPSQVAGKIATNIIINGFILQGGTVGVSIIDYAGTNPHTNFTVENCEIRYSEQQAINFGNWDGVVIKNNNIHHNGLYNYPRGSAPGVGWPGTIMGYADQWNFSSDPGTDGNTKWGTTNVTIENNKIHDNNGEGIIAGSFWTIKNNTFFDNYSVNVYLMPPWGNNVGAGYMTVDSNLIYNTGKYIGTTVNNPTDPRSMPSGVQVANEGADQHGHGTNAPGLTSITITNNIISNAGDGAGIQVLNYNSGPFYLTNSLIANNTIGTTYKSTPALSIGVSDNVTVANNLAIQNAVILSGLSTSSPFSQKMGIFADNNMVSSTSMISGGPGSHPVTLTNTTFGNATLCGGSNIYTAPYYSLENGSLGLGLGLNIASITDDYFGDPRPTSGKYDVGAVEGGGCIH